MKVKKLLGGILAGAMLLTSVPLMDAGGVTVKAEDSSEDLIEYYQLLGLTASADSQQTYYEAHKAVDGIKGNNNNFWHTSWGAANTQVAYERGSQDGDSPYYIDTLKGKNTITLTLKKPARVGYLKYTTRRDGNDNGDIRKMRVQIQAADSNEFKDVSGTQYNENNVPVNEWQRGQGVTYSYRLTDTSEKVAKIKIIVEEVYSKDNGPAPNTAVGSYISAAEIEIFGREISDVYGERIGNLHATADSSRDAQGEGADKAIDEDGNTFWHTDYNTNAITSNKNHFYIDLGTKYDINAITYQPRIAYSYNIITNGTITKGYVYVSTDGGKTYTYTGVTSPQIGDNIREDEGTCVASSDWTYTDGTTEEKQNQDRTEKAWLFKDENGNNVTLKGVDKIKIVVGNTTGTTKDTFICAAEFRVYGTKSLSPVKLTATANNDTYGSVSVSDESITGNTDYNGQFVPHGTELKLTATPKDGYVFSYWKDADTNRVVSNDATFTHTLLHDENFTAVFLNSQSSVQTYTVTYKYPSKFGDKIIDTYSVNADGSHTTLSTDSAQKFGYVFLNWVDFTDRAQTFNANKPITVTKDMVLEANYTAANTAKEQMIHISYPNTGEDGIDKSYPFDVEVGIPAAKTILYSGNTMNFIRWEIGYESEGDYKPVSTNPNYRYAVKEIDPTSSANEDVYLRAIYTKDGTHEFNPIVTLGILNRKVISDADTAQRVRIQVLFDSVDGVTVIEKGILASIDPAVTDDALTLDAVNESTVKRSSSTGQWQRGSLILNATMKGEIANKTMYCKGYMTYKKGNTIVTEYTDQVELTGAAAQTN